MPDESDRRTGIYSPAVTTPRRPLKFDANHPRFREQLAIIDEGLRVARGRFLVGMPDHYPATIANVDLVLGR